MERYKQFVISNGYFIECLKNKHYATDFSHSHYNQVWLNVGFQLRKELNEDES